MGLIFLSIISTLKYGLLPAGAALGVITGIMLPRLAPVQRHGFLVFTVTLVAQFILVKLLFLLGGDYVARIAFAFAMGYLAFALRLLR